LIFFAIWANKILYFIFSSAKVQEIFIQPWIKCKGNESIRVRNNNGKIVSMPFDQ
jgi:hypothetical protein